MHTPKRKESAAHAPVLEHQLHRDEHARQHDRHETQPLQRPEQLREELARAARPEYEPDEVRDSHQEHVHHAARGAHMPEPRALAELETGREWVSDEH